MYSLHMMIHVLTAYDELVLSQQHISSVFFLAPLNSTLCVCVQVHQSGLSWLGCWWRVCCCFLSIFLIVSISMFCCWFLFCFSHSAMFCFWFCMFLFSFIFCHTLLTALSSLSGWLSVCLSLCPPLSLSFTVSPPPPRAVHTTNILLITQSVREMDFVHSFWSILKTHLFYRNL